MGPERTRQSSTLCRCVAVSNDARHASIAQTGHGVITVVPLTSNADHVLACQTLVHPAPSNGLARPSKAQAEQIRSSSPQRVLRKLGSVSRETMAAIDEALRVHLMS
ncbi:type II toxin-antitoxin system PemK/MazF family toxin [Microbacterium faecale]|uniref:type II toxin-antitoxin system PemK/MazF family toxin n=1 Tax=Microbacterium faecale TaxID=1804630 RepID=UPI00402BA906